MKTPPLRNRVLLRLLLLGAGLLGIAPASLAQWQIQTNILRGGWNAVFLHVDASHATVDELIGPSDPIEEIWQWNPALPPGQTISKPQDPSDSQWSTWTWASGEAAELKALRGNTAVLVRVSDGTPPFEWRVPGKPVLPTYHWTQTGLNFLGFPTPPAAPPSFESFLAVAPRLLAQAEIYRYTGGDLGATNPAPVIALRTTPVARSEAYWIRPAESVSQYFGPFQVREVDAEGIDFGENRSQARFRIRNLVEAPLTVTLRQMASATAPARQPVVQGPPPLLLRTELNTTNLTYGYVDLAAGPRQWTLTAAGQPGSEVEVVVGLQRSAMAGSPGAVFAGILRFQDSLNLSQVDLGVSAVRASTAGLWVGDAVVTSVAHQLTSYAQAADDTQLGTLLARLGLGQGINGYRYEHDPNTGRVLVFGGPDRKTGTYLVDGPVRSDAGSVARAFPLRLILHADGAATRLLQKVYHGVGVRSNMVLATRESQLLPTGLAQARRITAVHLPTSEANVPWICTGVFQAGGTLSVTVPIAFDDHSSNPFLHTYHPDHDNLDATFAVSQARGIESFAISRRLTLTFASSADDFEGLTGAASGMSGAYSEVLTLQGRGSHVRQFESRGSFALKRISDIASLALE